MNVECAACENSPGCPALISHCRAVANAMLCGVVAPDCPHHRPLWWHGVDGVQIQSEAKHQGRCR